MKRVENRNLNQRAVLKKGNIQGTKLSKSQGHL